MCVTSMIYDHYRDKWGHPPYIYPPTWIVPAPQPSPPTPEEINEFHKLLNRARQWDKDHGQPDCELEEKRQKLKGLADQLGVAIDFV